MTFSFCGNNSLFLLLMNYLTISQERVSNVAYNIVNGVCAPVRDLSAPVYITIGDGGNIEGLATE